MTFLKKSSFLTLGATALLMAGAAYSVPANAQQETTSPTQQTQQQPANFTEDQIDAYVASARDIISIQQTMIPQIKSETDTAAQQEMMQDMRQQMLSAVEDNEEITVAEYNAISKAAQNDQSLAQQIETQLQATN